jgi:hypothetical protein
LLVGDPSTWTRTDAAGSFTMRTPATGHHALRILAQNGASKTAQIDLPATACEFRLD